MTGKYSCCFVLNTESNTFPSFVCILSCKYVSMKHRYWMFVSMFLLSCGVFCVRGVFVVYVQEGCNFEAVQTPQLQTCHQYLCHYLYVIVFECTCYFGT